MTDRQLLEDAAKAAGYDFQRSRLDDRVHNDFLMNGSSPRNIGQNAYPWNPLTDDGDALRLAVQLKLWTHNGMGNHHDQADPYAATRRAITRAAAEIGRAMP